VSPSLETLRHLDQTLQAKRIERISIQDSQGVEIVEVKDIKYLEADNNYTRFHLLGGRRFMASQTLKNFEDILEAEGFFRIHRSFLINLQQLKAYLQGEVGQALLKDGTRLEVSRRRAPMFVELLRKWKPS
jgi:two-component system LytT family response regulator